MLCSDQLILFCYLPLNLSHCNFVTKTPPPSCELIVAFITFACSYCHAVSSVCCSCSLASSVYGPHSNSPLRTMSPSVCIAPNSCVLSLTGTQEQSKWDRQPLATIDTLGDSTGSAQKEKIHYRLGAPGTQDTRLPQPTLAAMWLRWFAVPPERASVFDYLSLHPSSQSWP